MQGPQGPSGPAWLYQPSPELASKVKQAALNVTPRTVFDPRVDVRYFATLTSRLVNVPPHHWHGWHCRIHDPCRIAPCA